MTKAMYIGIGGKAHKTKKVYVGVGGKAHKVKKAYIGVGGKARLFFSSGGELKKYTGSYSGLGTSRYDLAATSIGDYALFGGGYSSDREAVVDAYNKSLTRSTPTNLYGSRSALAATSIGDYALFGGGSNSSGYSSRVDAYSTSLVRTNPTALNTSRGVLAATSVGDYALFGGGVTSMVMVAVDAYNKSLTRSTATSLSVRRRNLAATSVGDYALFGGGASETGSFNVNGSSVVDAYNKSLTRSTPSALSDNATQLAATSVGDYALFGGGAKIITTSGGTFRTTVDAYNSALTKTNPSPLSVERRYLAATSVGNYALFGGGDDKSTDSTGTVDAYDSSLTHSSATALSVTRQRLAATTVGDYAIFAGGLRNTSNRNAVDVYTVE